MKRPRSILPLWAALSSLLGLTLLMWPHKQTTLVSFLSSLIQLLLLLVSIQIIRFEPTKKNKFIFINFALLFSLSILFHFYNFVGPGLVFFTDEPFARFYFNQYVSLGGYFLLLAFALVYIAVDCLFREFKTAQKYLITFLIAGGFFVYYYAPFIQDPKYAHHTADILDWKTIEKTYSEYKKEQGVAPTPVQIAERTDIYTWNKGERTGVLYHGAALKRITDLYPYLEGDSFIILVFKPIYMNTIYMCVLSLGFILLFFGYQYMKDPPQGAYIEKIMFMFLIFCSMEIVHAWTFVKSIEWSALGEIMVVGQYVSLFILLLIAVFFGLRLRFITSVRGEFYEQELAVSPARVTRWRDALDNIVVEKFFDRKVLLGRLLVDPSHRPRTTPQ